MKRLLLLVALLGIAPSVAAQELIVVVRHAERADATADSPLSAAGEARARRLADLLKDAGISRIYTTDLRRTIQTAAPLADTLHVSASALPAADRAALLTRVRGSAPHDRLLIVGHSNTVPEILTALGVTETIAIADAEYDNLFEVVPQPGGAAPLLVRLRY